jgi:hypothetical protein
MQLSIQTMASDLQIPSTVIINLCHTLIFLADSYWRKDTHSAFFSDITNFLLSLHEDEPLKPQLLPVQTN